MRSPIQSIWRGVALTDPILGFLPYLSVHPLTQNDRVWCGRFLCRIDVRPTRLTNISGNIRNNLSRVQLWVELCPKTGFMLRSARPLCYTPRLEQAKHVRESRRRRKKLTQLASAETFCRLLNAIMNTVIHYIRNNRDRCARRKHCAVPILSRVEIWCRSRKAQYGERGHGL